MKTRSLRYLLLSAALLTLTLSCQKDELATSCDVSFKDDLVPILKTSCTGYCHTTFDHFSEFKNIKKVVDNGLLKEYVVTTKKMPLYPSFITDEERALFECWIDGGGLNN